MMNFFHALPKILHKTILNEPKKKKFKILIRPTKIDGFIWFKQFYRGWGMVG